MTEPRFDETTGLVPAIVQSSIDGQVLMLGWMNEDALAATRESGRVTFYSRSRDRLWEKGETSGNWLELVDVRLDCDRDTLLVTAVPHGPTCHTGEASCFGAGGPDAGLGAMIEELAKVVARRDVERPEDSYTASLLSAGAERIAQKVGEEAVEVALAAVREQAGGVTDLVDESADLLYHLVVLWRAAGVSTVDVARALEARR